MKKLSFISVFAVALFVLTGSGAKAQITLINDLPCPVIVFIEQVTGPGCNAGCPGGPVVIPPGPNGTAVIAECNPFFDLCVFVTRVGSCQVTTGVHLNATCHGGPILIDNGVVPANCCGAAPMGWTATWNPTTKTFHIQ